MKPVGLADKLLLGILLPLWVVCFGLGVRRALWPHQIPSLSVAADEAGGYPTLNDFSAWAGASSASGLQLGDRMIQVGHADLRGVGPVGFYARATAEAPYGEPAPHVIYERAGQRGEAELPLHAPYVSWYTLPASLAYAVAAVFIALRARGDSAARLASWALLFNGITNAHAPSGGVALNYAGLVVLAAAGTLAYPLGLLAIARVVGGAYSALGWTRFLPWLFPFGGVLHANSVAAFPLRFPVAVTLGQIHTSLFVVAMLFFATRVYRSADALMRRRIRWVVLGTYAAQVPLFTVFVLVLVDRLLFGEWQRLQPLVWPSIGFGVFIPLSILVAIARYNLFDVDRVLSAAASYNVAAVALVALALVGVPRMAEAASDLIGVDPEAGQMALSVALAAAVVPLQRRLRPRIDRWFFRERFALDHGIGELLGEIARAGDARMLTARIGEALERLFRPEACVVYAGTEGAFAPVFAAGRAVPPAFEAGSALVATLREQEKPLALSGAGRTPDRAELDPFDRAALEALSAEVVVPVRRDAALLAFLCLGPKRSGDVYTATDLSLLAAVAAAASAQLHRFDQEEVIAAGRAMQEALRRYVPGAVAEQLASGADPTMGEREVTVLFVDLRGYASFAEERRVEEIFTTVNRYTEAVSGAVRAEGGAVVEFHGDGMMAVFGAPQPLAQRERAAVSAGRSILKAVAALPPEKERGSLAVGVGIATGPAFVGSVRAVDRLIWTALGPTTNLAARLQALTRELDASLVVDAATWGALGTWGADFELHTAVALRGLRQREDVYALASPEGTRRTAGRIRREGDVWRIAYAGREVQLRDQRGLQYLAELLRHPGKEIHSLELVRAGSAAPSSSTAAASASDAVGALSVARGLGGAGEAIDARARAAYRARLQELDEELAEAERHHDLGRLETLNDERDALVTELAGALRGGGGAASDAERARVAVTKALKTAQEKIAATHPELAAHLAATLRRGVFCSYTPDPAHPVEWET